MDLGYSTLELSTTIGCPVACVYCPQAKTVKNYRGGERMMKVDTLEKCLSNVMKYNVSGQAFTRIEVSGFVEPYTNPQCSDLIRLTHDMGFQSTTLYTTLRGMKVADYHKIKHIPFYYVSIHLPDTEGKARIPIHDDYFELLGLLMDTYQIGWNIFGELPPEVRKFIEDKEPDAFNGKYAITYIAHSRAGNVDGISHVPRLNGHIRCSACSNMELNHNILLPNGDVALCCMDFSLQHIVGNLLTDDYLDLFKSAEHNKVVAGMYLDDMNSMCRICDYAVTNEKN